MKQRRSGPRRLTVVLDSLQNELAPETLLADVQRAWPAAVGDAISSEARPTAERAGVLTVACSASVWAAELDLMAPAIHERLNGLLHEARIVRLRCVAVPPPT